MKYYREYQPHKLLSEYVECYWILKSDEDSFSQKELIIPGGKCEIVFNYGTEVKWYTKPSDERCQTHKGSFLVGQRDTFCYAGFEPKTDLFAIRFRTGGFSAFNTTPLADVKNLIIPLNEIFSDNFKDVAEKLYYLKKDPDRISFVDTLLLNNLRTSDNINKTLCAIEYIKKVPDTQSIDEINRMTGTYYKSLERNFSKYAGYSPKHFARLSRFARVVRFLKQKNIPLTRVAIDGGYFDQSHFIREIKEFTGLTPKSFRKYQTNRDHYLYFRFNNSSNF